MNKENGKPFIHFWEMTKWDSLARNCHRRSFFAKAKGQCEKGLYASEALTYLKLKGEYLHEGEYQAAICYLAEHDQKNRSGEPKLAKTYLGLAAYGGHQEAALLLAERFSVRKYLTPETENAEARQKGEKERSAPAAQETPIGEPEKSEAVHDARKPTKNI